MLFSYMVCVTLHTDIAWKINTLRGPTVQLPIWITFHFTLQFTLITFPFQSSYPLFCAAAHFETYLVLFCKLQEVTGGTNRCRETNRCKQHSPTTTTTTVDSWRPRRMTYMRLPSLHVFTLWEEIDALFWWYLLVTNKLTTTEIFRHAPRTFGTY